MAHIQYSIPDTPAILTDEKLLYISSATYGSDWISMFHSHSFVELLYITDGEGLFCVQQAAVPVRHGSLILINPNTLHTEKSSKTHPLTYTALGIDNLHFQFSETEQNTGSGKVCGSDNSSTAVGGNYRVHDFRTYQDSILPLMQIMLTEVRSHLACSDAICRHCLSALLLKVLQITGDRCTSASAQNIPGECTFIKYYIDTHYQETLTLDTLAEVSHLNKYYLSHLFSAAFGISPINYLLERRILHSKELLRTTNYSVIQIAYMTGFSSANYFSQSFKKYTGLSPVAYRNGHST